MPILLGGRPGSVVQLLDPGVQCTVGRRLFGLDPAIDFDVYRSIVTRVTVSQQVNLQFLHSMGSSVYVYVFGDRMGQVGLSGLSFFGCDCPGDDLSTDDAYAWYKNNRASRRSDPVVVTVGSAVVTGFVTGFSSDVVEPSIGLVQWNVTMAALPDDD